MSRTEKGDLKQVTEGVQHLTSERDSMKQQLEIHLNHVDVTDTEACTKVETHVELKFTEGLDRIKAVTDVANEIARGAFDRFQQLDQRLDQLHCEFQLFRASPPVANHHAAASAEPSKPVPLAPPSWAQPTAHPSRSQPDAHPTSSPHFGGQMPSTHGGRQDFGGAEPATHIGANGRWPPTGMGQS